MLILLITVTAASFLFLSLSYIFSDKIRFKTSGHTSSEYKIVLLFCASTILALWLNFLNQNNTIDPFYKVVWWGWTLVCVIYILSRSVIKIGK